MTPTWVPFIYRDFYDIPRAIVLRYLGALLFLDDSFDDELDDYHNEFRVYLLPDSIEPSLMTSSEADRAAGRVAPSWKELTGLGRLLGTMPRSSLVFDQTLRRELDGTQLDSFLTVEGMSRRVGAPSRPPA